MTLADNVNTKSPFTKLFEKQVDKFKISAPLADKKNLGSGKASLQVMELNGSKMYKLIFKNAIGKSLYEANLSGKASKIKRVAEKAAKNQIKVITLMMSKDNKPMGYHTLLNFQRSTDMEEFEKEFKNAVTVLNQKKEE